MLLLDAPPSSAADANFVPADENDEPSVKAAAGMALQPPAVDYDGPVIDVPQGEAILSSFRSLLVVVVVVVVSISIQFHFLFMPCVHTHTPHRIDSGIGRRDGTGRAGSL